MQYIQYDRDIVQVYDVKLVGWTHPKWCSPSNLGSNEGQLITLNNALGSEDCKWVEVNDKEKANHKVEWGNRVESGDVRAPKARKPRKDKGTTRAKKARKVDSDDSDIDDNDQVQGCPPQPPVATSRQLGAPANPLMR